MESQAMQYAGVLLLSLMVVVLIAWMYPEKCQDFVEEHLNQRYGYKL